MSTDSMPCAASTVVSFTHDSEVRIDFARRGRHPHGRLVIEPRLVDMDLMIA